MVPLGPPTITGFTSLAGTLSNGLVMRCPRQKNAVGFLTGTIGFYARRRKLRPLSRTGIE